MANQNTYSAHPTIPSDRDILVCIFQRGAADGLNALIPQDDVEYDFYSMQHRPAIAVPRPGMPNGGIDLNNGYALHPALQALLPIYQAGDLALVHATGVPHGSRSHFAAQGLIERGVTDKAGPDTGWLGRHLALTPASSSSAFRIVSISGNVPVALGGAVDPLAISNLADFGFDQGIIDSGYPQVLADLFRSPVPFFGPAGAALGAIGELQAAELALITPDNNAVYPNTPLGNKLAQTGQLIKSNLPVEVVCLDSDGWDHHESLPTYINLSLTELAGAIAAFYKDMGTGMQRISLLVYTEFGRRVPQNGSFGVDHGTGSLAYLVGGGVNGGQVISDWPGLAPANLEMGEDLKITTDLRSVLSELLDKRLGGTDTGIVFPGYSGPLSADAFLA